MSGSERFALLSGIVGLLVNVITLAGFVVGFVELPNSAAFWARPGFVSVFSLFLLIACVLLLGIGVLKKVRGRSRTVSQNGIEADDKRLLGFVLLVNLVWIPVYILWLFAVVEINKLFVPPPNPDSVGEPLIVMLTFAAVCFGGTGSALAAASIDTLFAAE